MTREELIKQIRTKQSFLCVGLDTDIKKIPQHLLQADDPIFEFNKAIIDATAPYSVAYKPNLAFYESLGVKGLLAFERTVAYLNENYPEQFVIADAKRGDIGNTSQMYARTFFETYNLDALTVAPYMGEDSVTPFLAYEGKWVILLALTSNKGSHDFQLTEDAQGVRLFEHVLTKSQAWGNADNMMYVVGATQREAFKAKPFLARSWHRRTRWKSSRCVPIWYEQRLRLVGKQFARHYLCKQRSRLYTSGCRESTRGSRRDGTRIEGHLAHALNRIAHRTVVNE